MWIGTEKTRFIPRCNFMWNVSMNKIQSVALIVGIVFGVPLIVNAQATTFAQSDPHSTSVASGVLDLRSNLLYFFSSWRRLLILD